MHLEIVFKFFKENWNHEIQRQRDRLGKITLSEITLTQKGKFHALFPLWLLDPNLQLWVYSLDELQKLEKYKGPQAGASSNGVFVFLMKEKEILLVCLSQ